MLKAIVWLAAVKCLHSDSNCSILFFVLQIFGFKTDSGLLFRDPRCGQKKLFNK